MKTKQTKKQIVINKDLRKLTAGERKIYKSGIAHFPATKHLSALDAAIQGGVKWDFVSK